MSNSSSNNNNSNASDTAPYWYSTNGMVHKRLSNRHTALLDQAFDRRIRVKIYDIDAFGPSAVAVANPVAGTMTAGDIHYGLYRHPSLVLNNSSAAIDSLIFMDSDNLLLPQETTTTTHESFRDVGSTATFDIFSPAEYHRFSHHHHHQQTTGRRRSMVVENQCVCSCTIM
ncbi:hypothetical protein BDB00DRAFT_873937 [Zychaea mexicana]|uniref:uncharacterized protein n=1 Tax=Zychaea mexicana TaxID=64656 RepID=UPI0022FE3487|nr:uncharacterized protein BDB00DRAFT_873937 [Zychaea mexicana]KAI9491910.1 hypothetical protein BDB00DRAFT_873937 [Zychaea mexicana]